MNKEEIINRKLCNSNIGYDPLNGKHVFIKLNGNDYPLFQQEEEREEEDDDGEEKEKEDCKKLCGLKEYSSLQIIDLSGNNLIDNNIKILSEFKLLVKLDLSRNKLKRVLDFYTPSCITNDPNPNKNRKEYMWIGSQLKIVDLSHNLISSINDLSWHCNLRVLDLSYNKLEYISGLDNLKHLEILNLQHNYISNLIGFNDSNPEEQLLPSLEELYLDDNRIQNLQPLENLNSDILMVLSVNNNEISSLEFIRNTEFFDSLLHLQLGENKISKFNQIKHLNGSTLESLRLIGNPISQQQFYRARVIHRVSNIHSLDDVNITAKEKVSAANIHGADVQERKLVFQRHINGHAFVNYLPVYKDPEEVNEKVVSVISKQAAESFLQDGIIRYQKFLQQNSSS